MEPQVSSKQSGIQELSMREVDEVAGGLTTATRINMVEVGGALLIAGAAAVATGGFALVFVGGFAMGAGATWAGLGFAD
jgi:hypothetical protein